MNRKGHRSNVPTGTQREAPEVVQQRRPYSAPRILFRETLEVVASTCSSLTAKSDVGSCPLGPVQS